MRSEREIDEAIDRAVREMMRHDPRPGLRARVLSRIERPSAAWTPALRAASAAALLGALAIAAVVSRPAPEPVRDRTSAAAEPPGAPAPASPVAPAPGAAPPGIAPPRTTSPRRSPAAGTPGTAPVFPPRGTVAAATVLAGDPDATASDALPEVAPVFTSADGPPIVIPEISIAPLVLERLAVTPIPPPR